MKLKLKGRIANDEIRIYIKKSLKKIFPKKFYLIIEKQNIISRRDDEEIIQTD